MGKSKQNDDTDQKHKKHNTKSTKLKKRHEKKKMRRKVREDRHKHKMLIKEKDALKKLKFASEAWANKVKPEDIYTVKKIIGKLIKHNYESVKELP